MKCEFAVSDGRYSSLQSAPSGGNGSSSGQTSNGRNIILNIWDFAGQAAYYTTHQVSYICTSSYSFSFNHEYASDWVWVSIRVPCPVEIGKRNSERLPKRLRCFVRQRERERGRERDCVSVRVRVRERERERERECVCWSVRCVCLREKECVRERESVSVGLFGVCVWERESECVRERERDRELFHVSCRFHQTVSS